MIKNKCWQILVVLLSLSSLHAHGEAPLRCPLPDSFKVDSSWPKPLPHNWILGEVSALFIDSRDHVWIMQRPGTLNHFEKGAALNPPIAKCCIPAPPVIEFDENGNVVQAWGGPNNGYPWPSLEHGLFVDYKGFVWITGRGKEDTQVFKFTRDGKFIMAIGKGGPLTDSNDVTRLGKPASVDVDPETNEIYVADGYFNHRIIVFDADTGAFKRYWGAYGKPPKDTNTRKLFHLYPPLAASLQQFATPVHCVHLSRDGLVYVCDRVNNRIQIFHKDGSFVQEFFIYPDTAADGSVWDIAFSLDPEQCYMYVIDGSNNEIHVLERKTGKLIGNFGRQGRYAGQFGLAHSIALDSKGNIFTTEVKEGKRVQKFIAQPAGKE